MYPFAELEPWLRRNFAFQAFVARLTVGSYTVPVEQHSIVLNNPKAFIVRAWPSTDWIPRSMNPFDPELPTGEDS